MKKLTDHIGASVTLSAAAGLGVAGVAGLLVIEPAATLFTARLAALAAAMAITSAAVSISARLTLRKINNRLATDALTHLMNREAFMAKLAAAVGEANAQVALLFVDINKFKSINDSLGHLIGDELLVSVARRIKDILPSRCVLGRLGADEFGIIITRASDRDVDYLAKAIAEIFYQPHDLPSGHKVEVSVALGVAWFPAQAKTVGDLTRFADLAMRESKRTSRPIVTFSPKMSQSSEDELFLLGALRHALEHDQFRLEYQPKVNTKTKQLEGIEALIRWEHPILGRVLPDRFIHVAEQQGLIRPITEWVITQALRDLHEIRAAGVTVPNVSVNISPYTVMQGTLLVYISKALAQEGVDPNSLMLEITESYIQHQDQDLIKVLVCLDMVGIGIAIDDFGTGQSSLLYLKHIPTAELKIDRSFVRTLCLSDQDLAIIRAVISLAHDLDCSVCAEGVENEETLALLGDLECDTVQGFLTGKPQPKEQLIKTYRK